MTVENTIAKYKKYVEVGNDAGAEVLKQHMLTAKKYQGHPFLQELGVVKPEVKPVGKKPKG